MLHCHVERYAMHGFAIMPNHVHLAVKPLHEWEPETAAAVALEAVSTVHARSNFISEAKAGYGSTTMEPHHPEMWQPLAGAVMRLHA